MATTRRLSVPRSREKIQLRTYPTRSAFEGSLGGGEPDFAFTSPYYYLIARKRHGYLPLIRSEKPLRGILVVRKESDIRQLRDLDGHTLAFPSPNAYAASLYMRALLIEQEKISFTPVYVETHDNVYRNVLFGNAAAGGGVARTLNAEPEQLRQRLRIIYQTPDSAPHPLSAHPRVPVQIREAVIAAMLKLQTSEDGRAMLDRVKIRKPLRAEHVRDYGFIAELGLDKYGTFSP